MEILTGEELLAMANEPSDWGPWRLYPPTLVLVLVSERSAIGTYEQYEVDLERCLTSAAVLDWICQLAGKGFGTDAVLAGLVRALDDILDPQASLCSFGQSKAITAERVADLVAKAAGLWPQLVHVRIDDEG